MGNLRQEKEYKIRKQCQRNPGMKSGEVTATKVSCDTLNCPVVTELLLPKTVAETLCLVEKHHHVIII